MLRAGRQHVYNCEERVRRAFIRFGSLQSFLGPAAQPRILISSMAAYGVLPHPLYGE